MIPSPQRPVSLLRGACPGPSLSHVPPLGCSPQLLSEPCCTPQPASPPQHHPTAQCASQWSAASLSVSLCFVQEAGRTWHSLPAGAAAVAPSPAPAGAQEISAGRTGGRKNQVGWLIAPILRRSHHVTPSPESPGLRVLPLDTRWGALCPGIGRGAVPGQDAHPGDRRLGTQMPHAWVLGLHP